MQSSARPNTAKVKLPREKGDPNFRLAYSISRSKAKYASGTCSSQSKQDNLIHCMEGHYRATITTPGSHTPY